MTKRHINKLNCKHLKIKCVNSGNFICTLITEVFPGTRKIERKEKPLKKSCQNPVEYAR